MMIKNKKNTETAVELYKFSDMPTVTKVSSLHSRMNTITLIENRNKIILMNTENPIKKEIKFSAQIKNAVNLQKSKYMYVELKNHQHFLIDLESGTKAPIKKLKNADYNIIEEYENYLYLTTKDEKEGLIVKRIDLKLAQTKEIHLKLATDNISISARGKILFSKKTKEDYINSLHLTDIETSNIKNLNVKIPEYNFKKIIFSADGNLLYLPSDEQATLLNLQTNELKSVPLSPGTRLISAAISPENSSILIVQREKRDYSFLHWDLNKEKTKTHEIPFATIRIDSMQYSADGKSLLVEEFGIPPISMDFMNWQQFKSTTINKNKEFSKMSLKSLIEKGHFKITADFPRLYNFFKEGSHKKDSTTAQLLLFELVKDSPNTVNELLKEFPEILSSIEKNNINFSSISPHKVKEWKKMAESYVYPILHGSGDLTKFSNIEKWNAIRILKPLFNDLTVDDKKTLINKIAGAVSDGAVSRDFFGLFSPKVFKFSKQEIRKWFSEKPKNITDLAIARDNDKIRLYILGSQAIDNDSATNTKYGFYAKQLNPILIPKEAVKEGTIIDKQIISWLQGKQKFTANIEVKSGKPISEIIPKAPAPSYKNLWEDKKLTGAVVTGVNMQDENPALLNEYISYYKEKGFKFNKPQPIKDMKNFLETAIKRGELDYLIKEAHSDGMEHELFRLYKTGNILTGVKKINKGEDEIIYIFIPKAEKKSNSLISNAEFGSWIQEREKIKNTSPLYYFNTSCFGVDKACNEFEAAGSPKLMVYATQKMADTFINEEGSALQQMLTGFREKKSYAEIRKMMEKDPSYKDGTDNTYLFPDQKEFEEAVLEKIKTPLQIKIDITDHTGKAYFLDTAE